ncbi:MAG: hypothetical protein ACJ8CR_34000 [Roseiflexaceae bacterium]
MRHGKPIFQLLLMLALIVPAVHPARSARAADPPLAPIVYIAPDGDDARDCATPLSRCATLRHGLERLAIGGQARMAAGIYAGTTDIERSAIINGGYTLPGYLPGEAPTVLDGRRQGNTLRIDQVPWVRLSDLTITGGLADPGADMTGRGGGIFVRDANITLDRVVVRNNIADIDGSGRGGGLYIRDGSLTLLRSVIISNTASLITIPSGGTASTSAIVGSGGGVYALDSQLAIRQSLLVDNSAVEGGSGAAGITRGWGGGLYAQSCVLEADAARFLENNALATVASGGAIKLLDSQAWLRGGEISDNQTASDGGIPSSGGGIDILSGTTTLVNVALRRNAAADGSGIRLRPYAGIMSGTVVLTLTNALLAGHGGAALALAPNGGAAARAMVRYTTLISNGLGLLAGAQQAIDVTNSLIVGNVIAAQASDGGAILLTHTNRYGNGQAAVGDIRIGPAGDLALPPGFVPGDQSFRLALGSPLLDQGTPLADVTTDYEGQPRHIDGDGDGLAWPDLGWDELARSAAAFGPDQTIFAQPGQTLTTTLELRNTGLVSDTFRLSTAPPPGWGAMLLPNQVVLGPRTRARLTLTIAVSAAALRNTQSQLAVRAVGQTSAALTRVVVNVVEP